MPPFTKLPHILIPRASYKRMPPIMHYGWPADVDFLFNYAQQHDLIRYRKRFVAGDENGKKKKIDVVDRDASASDALEHIVESIGGPSSPLHIELEPVLQEQNGMIVSLFTNYTIQHAPTQEFKRQLCEQLGFTGEPKWYLDCFDWHWQNGIPECMHFVGSGLFLVK